MRLFRQMVKARQSHSQMQDMEQFINTWTHSNTLFLTTLCSQHLIWYISPSLSALTNVSGFDFIVEFLMLVQWINQFSFLLLSSLFWPDISVETVSGTAAGSIPVSFAASAVSVQPGEGAAESAVERWAGQCRTPSSSWGNCSNSKRQLTFLL